MLNRFWKREGLWKREVGEKKDGKKYIRTSPKNQWMGVCYF